MKKVTAEDVETAKKVIDLFYKESATAIEEKETEKTEEKEEVSEASSYWLKEYALIFSSKRPHDYTDLGAEETPKTIYEKGESFSVRGDNFSWIHIGVLFEYKAGKKTGEGVYSRPLNADASFDPQGVPQIKGLELDPVGVKNLESQLKIFSGNMVKLPPPGNPILAEAPSEGLNRLLFNEDTMEGLLKGRSMSSLRKISGVDFSDKYDSFSYRLNHKGRLFSVFRQPVKGFQGTPEHVHETNTGEDGKEKSPFEPVDEQKKKKEEKEARMSSTKSSEKSTDAEKQSGEGYETGGFDILKKLVQKQRKDMPLRKADMGMSQPAQQGGSFDHASLKKKEKEHGEKSKLYKQMADTVKKIETQKTASVRSVLKNYFRKFS